MKVGTCIRYLLKGVAVAADLVPAVIVAAAIVGVSSGLGNPVWMQVVCGVVIVIAVGFAWWNGLVRRRHHSRRRLVVAAVPPILVLVLLVSLQALVQHRADRDLASARDTVAGAASDSAVVVLSYKPDTVDRDLASAKSRLTGEFLDTYGQLADTVVGPTAKEKQVSMDATPAGAGVESVSEDKATVIVYINQTTTVAGNPQPSQSQNALRVGLTKVQGRWLINRFDPLF